MPPAPWDRWSREWRPYLGAVMPAPRWAIGGDVTQSVRADCLICGGGVHLAVEDITEARAELVRRGVEISEIRDFGGGVKGADFSDPDCNTFELQ